MPQTYISLRGVAADLNALAAFSPNLLNFVCNNLLDAEHTTVGDAAATLPGMPACGTAVSPLVGCITCVVRAMTSQLVFVGEHLFQHIFCEAASARAPLAGRCDTNSTGSDCGEGGVVDEVSNPYDHMLVLSAEVLSVLVEVCQQPSVVLQQIGVELLCTC